MLYVIHHIQRCDKPSSHHHQTNSYTHTPNITASILQISTLTKCRQFTPNNNIHHITWEICFHSYCVFVLNFTLFKIKISRRNKKIVLILITMRKLHKRCQNNNHKKEQTSWNHRNINKQQNKNTYAIQVCFFTFFWHVPLYNCCQTFIDL